MTAEVAVINSTGVALAADSAVTIGSEKIYNSALKLFSLSKTEPVGIMIYGNAVLLNMPWETVIKIFRNELGKKSYERLEDYSNQFLKFLSSRTDFFPEEAQQNWLLSNVRGYYEIIFEDLIAEVENKIKEDGKITEETTKNIIDKVVDVHYTDLKRRSSLPNMDKKFEEGLRKKYRIQIQDTRNEIFKGLAITRPLITKLNAIAAMLHTRDIFSQSRSGIVISGFGTKDLFPALETHEIEGVISDRVKFKRLDKKSIRVTKGTECSVIPFAQDDMVASFMNGVNPSVHAFVISYLSKVFERLPELIEHSSLCGNDNEKSKTLDKYRKNIGTLLNDFFAQLNTHTQREHVQPIMQMVHALPKDELAAMAESLVNLTAFKRKMTRTLETVGGPIDVAVISKGDGLVWVKRKHYFPKELNQHFFANYYRGI